MTKASEEFWWDPKNFNGETSVSLSVKAEVYLKSHIWDLIKEQYD